MPWRRTLDSLPSVLLSSRTEQPNLCACFFFCLCCVRIRGNCCLSVFVRLEPCQLLLTQCSSQAARRNHWSLIVCRRELEVAWKSLNRESSYSPINSHDIAVKYRCDSVSPGFIIRCLRYLMKIYDGNVGSAGPPRGLLMSPWQTAPVCSFRAFKWLLAHVRSKYIFNMGKNWISRTNCCIAWSDSSKIIRKRGKQSVGKKH